MPYLSIPIFPNTSASDWSERLRFSLVLNIGGIIVRGVGDAVRGSYRLLFDKALKHVKILSMKAASLGGMATALIAILITPMMVVILIVSCIIFLFGWALNHYMSFCLAVMT